MKKLTLPVVTFFVLVALFLLGAFSSVASSGTTKAARGDLQSVVVTFYSDQGTMADGQQTHIGACAALVTQFPFGTKIQLFDPQNLRGCVQSRFLWPVEPLLFNVFERKWAFFTQPLILTCIQRCNIVHTPTQGRLLRQGVFGIGTTERNSVSIVHGSVVP